MKSASLATLAVLFGLAAAETEWYVQTKTFGSPDFHVFPELNGSSTTGLVLGWTCFGIVLVISAVITFVATWKRNVEYTKDLAAARQRMEDLGLNLEEVDKEFEALQKGGLEAEEAESFLDVAVKEGQKIREAAGGRTNKDNQI